MDFYRKTTLGLFDSSQKSFEIPVYQRAYSWEKDQWQTFLNDLLEQIEGENNYFYGNILLETVKKDVKYEIIDGQQRLTTLTIFIRSILNVLKKREKELEDFDFQTKENIFLKNGGNIKLRPVEYDRACFDSLIIDNQKKFETNTPSQVRIKEAKTFFVTELEKLKTDILLRVLTKIETTDLTIIELEGKKDSALMFELENNRGKDLTNMEKIKSYFMYQMYVYSDPEETESNIENVSNIFKLIYLIINDFKRLNEDSVLIYHNNAYIKGYNYRTLEDVKEVFKDDITAYLADTAAKASMELPIKAVLTDSLTGKTARYLAAFRGPLPVMAMCYNKRVGRELALSYGVFPRLTEPGSSKSEIIQKTVRKLQKKEVLGNEDLVAYLGGSFGIGGGTTYLEITTVEGLLNKVDRYID